MFLTSPCPLLKEREFVIITPLLLQENLPTGRQVCNKEF